jgi:hypothetical protein
MPLFKTTSMKISTVRIDSFWKMEVSAKLYAGIEIDNANFLGADLHSTIVDVYYPDWDGNLKHIGTVTENKEHSDNHHHGGNGYEKNQLGAIALKGGTQYSKQCIPTRNDDEGENDDENGENDENNDESSVSVPTQPSSKNRFVNSAHKTIKHDHKICLIDNNAIGSSSTNGKTKDSPPFFSVQARGTSISEAEAITIFLHNVGPKIYLNILKDAVLGWGSVEISVSGGAHVKSPMGIPLSLGLMCDSTLHLLQLPMQMVGKTCVVTSVKTGWTGLEELAAEVQDDAMQIFEENGTILDRRKRKKEERKKKEVEVVQVQKRWKNTFQARRRRGGGGKKGQRRDRIEALLPPTEWILDWHDF